MRRSRCVAFSQVSYCKPVVHVGGSRFLQTDPVEGGLDTNDYAYVKDPVNEFDLNGEGFCAAGHNPKNGRKHGGCRGGGAARAVGGVAKGAVRLPTNVAGRTWGFAADLAGGSSRSCSGRTRCVSGSWLIVPWASAGTLGNTIVCRRACDSETVAHESVHVRQFQQGGVGFVGLYGWESAFGGIRCGNKYERSAYAAGLGPC